jgi:hypothetical protein
MRTLNIRMENQHYVDDLSKRLGCDCTNASSVEILKGVPNLFGFEYMYEVHKKASSPRIRKLDISKYDWDNMPPYQSKTVYPYAHLKLETNMGSEELSSILEQPITENTKSVWYPKLQRQSLSERAWNSHHNLKPQYPIYIISKGRWDKCKTASSLDWMGLDYSIVVEPQEAEKYREVWGDRVLVGDFDTTTRSSIPVRNWVDQHCKADKYWLMDDNINYFYILNDNQSWRCKTGAIFVAIEDYVNRYNNIALAGLNKLGFCKPTDKVAPYVLNTRVYSMTLMNKAMNEKIKIDGQLWRGRYNEDTDLCIRFLKQGYCTINFQMFLGDKATTMTIKGGNTDSVYVDGDNRLTFAQSLADQHPDVARVTEKWGRFHHQVDWSVFKQRPIKKDQYQIRDYGLFIDDY